MNFSGLWVRVIILAGALLLIFAQNITSAQDTTQDIQGGASIFLPRPNNPHVRPHRQRPNNLNVRPHTQRPSKPNAQAGNGTSSGSVTKNVLPSAPPQQPQSKADLRDETEDALALANSARDATPPRYQDAERAYKLAVKLSPNDPRPYVGLGNIFYDQKQYAEAANAYREALRLQKLHGAIGALIGSLLAGQKGAVAGAAIGSVDVRYAELHAYIGDSLLRQQKWHEAEVELRKSIFNAPKNARFHALLGYALFEQKKYDEANASYEKALQLDPKNTAYKELLEKSHKEQNDMPPGKAITPTPL
jgi:Tfp pilus assembly protein PilF